MKIALFIFLFGLLSGAFWYGARLWRAVRRDMHGDCDEYGNWGVKA